MKACNSWLCKHCGETFRTKRLLQEHRKDVGIAGQKGFSSITFVKSYFKCPFCGIERISRNSHKMNHISHCKLNPDRSISTGHKCSEETRKKLSESLKKAHAEGRAGTFPSRKNCEHSYPEKWLIGVLNRELGLIENKDYETEYYFCKQFLDFAWPQKKLCIEVDGQQHERFEYRKLMDAKKDENLKADNWKLLRLKWSDVCNDTQKCVQTILDFLRQEDIGSNPI